MSLLIYPGAVVALTVTFQQSGVNTDPAGAISVVVKDSAGTKTTYTYAAGQVPSVGTLGKVGVGVYEVDVAVGLAGTWYFRGVAGPGSGQAADEAFFLVTASNTT